MDSEDEAPEKTWDGDEALEPWDRDDIESWIADHQTATEFNCAHRTLAAIPWRLLSAKLPLLRGINAEHNQLTEVGPELGELSGLLLSWLSVDWPLIAYRLVKSWVVQLALNLGHNDIQALPTQLGDCRELRALRLSGNELRELPYEVGFLGELEKLFLGDNQMENLPHRLTQCTKLQMLHLQNNAIRKLPTEIAEWTQLTQLQLSNNAIRELPQQIGTLTALQELIVSRNSLRSLPASIMNLVELRKLDVSGNKIEGFMFEDEGPVARIDEGVFGTLVKLEVLMLNNNALPALPEDLGNCEQLTMLFAGGNQIEGIPSSLPSLLHLTTLHMAVLAHLALLGSGNKLTTLPLDLARLTTLKSLKVSSNRLRSVPAELVEAGNEGLIELDLDNNPIEEELANEVWGFGAAELAPDAAMQSVALREKQLKAAAEAAATKALLDKEADLTTTKEEEKGLLDQWFG